MKLKDVKDANFDDKEIRIDAFLKNATSRISS